MSVTTSQQVTRIGPTGRSRVWLGDRTLASNAGVEQITAELRGNPDARAWWCLPMDAVAHRRYRGRSCSLDALAVDDVLGLRETPKLDDIGDTVILLTRADHFPTEPTPS